MGYRWRKVQNYVEHVIVPTPRPNDIVVMVKIGSHKVNAVAGGSAARNKTRVPAKIPPDLNPIKQVFAKLKHLLRSRRAQCRGGLRRDWTHPRCV